MKNACSPTLKVPIVILSQHCLKVRTLFWDSKQSLNCNPPYKLKRQIIYFLHTVAQNIHYYYSKGDEKGHNEQIVDQSKTQESGVNSPSCNSLSDVKGLGWLFWISTPSFADCYTLFCWDSSTSFMQLSLADISKLWHLQYLKRLQHNPALTFTLYEMVLLGLYARTALPNA